MTRSPIQTPTRENDKIWAAGALVLGIAAAALLFASPTKSQTIAAWVQAVGSIAAIFIALRVGQQQSKAAIEGALDAQRMAEKTKLKSVLAIASSAHDLATSIRAAFASKDVNWALLSIYDPKVIQQVIIALNSAPLHDIGSTDGVSALLSFRLQFVLLGNAVDAFIAGPWKHPELGASLRKYQEDISFDPKILASCETTGRDALKKNVFTHLEVIDRNHDRLQQTATS